MVARVGACAVVVPPFPMTSERLDYLISKIDVALVSRMEELARRKTILSDNSAFQEIWLANYQNMLMMRVARQLWHRDRSRFEDDIHALSFWRKEFKRAWLMAAMQSLTPALKKRYNRNFFRREYARIFVNMFLVVESMIVCVDACEMKT